MTTEFYDKLVPRDRAANLRYRRRVLDLAYGNPRYQEELWIMCRRDKLFFINTFCWIFEPRPVARTLPFITREYQNEFLLTLDATYGLEDLGVEKSRDVGATWCVCGHYFHKFLFFDSETLGLMSRNEDAVDLRDDKSSLFWKLDFLMGQTPDGPGIPVWLRPRKFDRKEMRYVNRDNGALIVGSPATANAFTSGRLGSLLMDEFAKFPRGADRDAMASTQYVTNNRILLSTYKGCTGAFYDAMQGDGSLRKVVLDWKDDPAKRAGLYTSEDGKLKILDESYQFPEGYPFNLDGKVRSPYYDAECARPGATTQNIAEELDRDPAASGNPFFDLTLLDQVLKRDVRDPVITGMLTWDADDYTPHFERGADGSLKLWCPVDSSGKPPKGQGYVIGCDVAAGTGGDYSSNSTAVVFSRETGEQVAEFATRFLFPQAFSQYVVALAKMFHGAFIVPEVNGPTGAQFRVGLAETAYSNVYIRKQSRRGEATTNKMTKKVGFHSDNTSQPALLGAFQEAIKLARIVLRSRELVKECREFVWLNAVPVHAKSKNTDDESAKGLAHGDRVIAAACGNEGLKERPPERRNRDHIPEDTPLENISLEELHPLMPAYRWKLVEMEKASADDPW